MPINKSQAKYIQSLAHKKFRDQEGVFVAEGPKTVGELLSDSRLETVWLYATKEWAGWTNKEAASKGLLEEVSQPELERISFLSTPNQVLGIFRKPVFTSPYYKRNISLVLDGIQDPGNLGTIVRIADWFGIPRIFCTTDSADVFSAKAVQSTMGSLGRVEVSYGDLDQMIPREAGLPVYAAVLEGAPLFSLPKAEKGLILIGNESKGIRTELLKRAEHRVTIPRTGEAESLNAAVATGIILSHLI